MTILHPKRATKLGLFIHTVVETYKTFLGSRIYWFLFGWNSVIFTWKLPYWVDRYASISVRVTRYATRLPWMCSNAWDVPFNLLGFFFDNTISPLYPSFTQLYPNLWWEIEMIGMHDMSCSYCPICVQAGSPYPWLMFFIHERNLQVAKITRAE